ncbi:hypothetical protein KN10_0410 [Anoxybacillus flavithermus NBRC 109594]|uniref:Uncharacterized protein n=1 Tax=Anoxybacillus flavithermus NBRC 109594 TaxID=1315967 RepID=R4FZP0_9BACL|nr:hypothetical protein KN10_0410 [Anoxybacillus flavithermus NBRC 109594]
MLGKLNIISRNFKSERWCSLFACFHYVFKQQIVYDDT